MSPPPNARAQFFNIKNGHAKYQPTLIQCILYPFITELQKDTEGYCF